MVSVAFTSCDSETDEEAGGTNVQKMAGNWVVTVNVVDENGNILQEDPSKLGSFSLNTYNTAANDCDSMWIDDGGKFWAFKFKTGLNYTARTFSCENISYDANNSGTATILNGKVLEGAAKNIHGMPNDSIVFDIKFSDDTSNLIYRIAGQRYQGFTE